jgi:hypothetical protein
MDEIYTNKITNMKKLFVSLLFICVTFLGKAQVPSNITPGTWQNAILRADGSNIVGGVEAYCMKGTCNSDDFVWIKLVNNNNFQIGVQWVDAIYVNNTWNHQQTQITKTIYIPANSAIEGNCTSDPKLRVLINTITNSTDPNKHYTVEGLSVTQ